MAAAAVQMPTAAGVAPEAGGEKDTAADEEEDEDVSVDDAADAQTKAAMKAVEAAMEEVLAASKLTLLPTLHVHVIPRCGARHPRKSEMPIQTRRWSWSWKASC